MVQDLTRRGTTATNSGSNPRPVPNPRRNDHTIGKKKHEGEADRAFQYKKCQELYRKNCKELASNILDGGTAATPEAGPAIEGIHRHYINIYGNPGENDREPITQRPEKMEIMDEWMILVLLNAMYYTGYTPPPRP